MDGDEGTRMVRLLALLGLFSACAKVPDKPDLDDAPASVVEHYNGAVERLLSRHIENGWVVSRAPDGSPAHVGEGLIWTGLLLAALPCDLGDTVEAHLIDAIERHDGALVRYEPLGEYEGGREVSADGALGLYRGIAHRTEVCGTGSAWTNALRLHQGYIKAHGGRLNANAEANLGVFADVLRLVASRVPGSSDGGPSDQSLRSILQAVTAWSAGVTATKAACFRIHLGWLALRTLETSGYSVSDGDRQRLCFATAKTDIPVLDHWCGRGDLKGWIEDFEFNRFEYAFQRCPRWEDPDGDGDETPGLDYLIGIKEAYEL